ncbi:MAG TPA: DmsE family decaheme c-type cytochrome [Thermoanaerobaculia bacterium]|nr:DmsE family decaheme c-type cytochrome [Thermoanaerobaculia bacterium]
MGKRLTFGIALCFGMAVALGLVASTVPGTASAQAQEQGLYAGAATCLECHSDMGDTLAGTPHGQSGFGKLSDRGCESCHGPAMAHADDPGDPSLFPRFSTWSAARQAESCQQCHSGASQFFWDEGEHAKRGLSCTTCHSVHSPISETAQLQAVRADEQCFSCHKDVRAETWKRSHHPIREGKISCTDCHNPHGSSTDKMIKASSVNEQCYDCHTEKRGPFLWEHPPVRESCLNCHTPHGSNHLKLQKTSVPFICQQCHLNPRHPSTLYDRTTLADGTRPSNRDFSRACVNCHSAVHGSNHPSAPYLAH